ncbi:MAG TPA: hypothetical protein VIA06_01595 [Candidatus Dormibacteraeota bacterium]|jgi:hypothetical protein|nr:hypothetical protein [Candidatus Dormibacteraeota bacterium]
MPSSTKRNATVEEILAAVETAKERVMADEVKSYTKLGIPKAMAYQMVASRFRQKSADDDPDPFEATTQEGWDG